MNAFSPIFSRFVQLFRVLRHPVELRLALSGLGTRLGGNEAMGGLTEEESSGLVSWIKECMTDKDFVVVEIGTLFGFTAKRIVRETGAKVKAVDIFCWNPFGLTPNQHEAFTRRILSNELADGSVELIRQDSQEYLRSMPSVDFVFLDGNHQYAAVKAELEILKLRGVRYIAGHDFNNSRFGVTRAVREVLGDPDALAGMCWLKKMA